MHTINISIVYALPQKQYQVEMSVPRGTNAIEAVALSGIKNQCSDLDDTNEDEWVLGVFAQKVDHDYLLQEGDRVEVYRPLQADPKEVRRQLAMMGKTMGKK